MTYLRSLFFDNPVLDYFNRTAWRRWRKWGWLVALAPLATVGCHFLFEGLYLTTYDPTSPDDPTASATVAGGMALAAFVAVLCVFSLAPAARLLRPDRVESALPTPLDPLQILENGDSYQFPCRLVLEAGHWDWTSSRAKPASRRSGHGRRGASSSRPRQPVLS